MRVYRSNRAERLLDALASVLADPLADPLAAEHVVVQSRGMERWLAMQLSRALGIAANLRFPFPRHFIEDAFEHVLGESNERAAPWSRDALAWSVAAVLRERLHEPAFGPARHYLEGDEGGVLALQLARRLSQALDDYAVYRPELLLSWERGDEPHDMQAQLLRALVERHGSFHQASRAQRLLRALEAPSAEVIERMREGLPERVCLFGVASLPPLYVRMLAALAQHVQTHLFVLTPSDKYFAELRKQKSGTPLEGPPLLAALGRLGRDFQAVLEECAEGYVEREGLFDDPGTDTLLHALQSDMLELRDRGGPQGPAPIDFFGARGHERAQPIPSVAIHACHSAMREVEVLHDQLARLLEDEALEPHDIVVMTPDIEAYAPMIEAVFNASTRGGFGQAARPFIPYSVAHRGLRPESAAFDALLAALDLLTQRVTAGGVLDLLGREPVRAHVGLSHEELETLRGWVEAAGIRWGVDELDRAEAGQPALVSGTFRFGLERMLLGYAFEGGGERTFGERLPFDAVQGSAALLAGGFADFCERLFRHRGALRGQHGLAQWASALEGLLADLVGDRPEHALERLAIRAALAELRAQASAAGFVEAVALQALLPLLEATIDARAAARGFLSRGVTLCQLVPMRSVPFKVVCILGMGDDRFPSRRTVHGFDRLQEKPRVGDRVPRDDDRHVFLEALLCARERFIVTYVGRSAHDGREQPPAVVVTDLLDAVARGFVVPDANADARKAAYDALVVEHRLHAFSARYFEGSDRRFFSYAATYCDGARSAARGQDEPRFIPRPLVQAPLEVLPLRELQDWVTQPIDTLVKRVLLVRLGSDLAPIPDREPATLDALENWSLGSEVNARVLAAPEGTGDEALIERMMAEGGVPVGANGVAALQDMVRYARRLSGVVRPWQAGAKLAAVPVDLEIDGVRLVGRLDRLWPGAQLAITQSQRGRRFELQHFVLHVVLSALRERGVTGLPEQSVAIGKRDDRRDDVSPYVVSFAPVPNASLMLAELIEWVRNARTRPIPFHHNAAFAYAFKNPDFDREAAIEAALEQLKPELGGGHPYVKLVYGDPLELLNEENVEQFESAARYIFGLMRSVRREERGA